MSSPETPRRPAAVPDSEPPALCPRCGLTRAELNQHGLMGCAVCYETFADVVVQATAALHGAKLAEAPPLTPPRSVFSGTERG